MIVRKLSYALVCVFLTLPLFAGDCIFPGSYTVDKTGSGPYTYLFTIDLDTVAGNDTKAIEITYNLSGGSTATVCYPPGTYTEIITHSFPNESNGNQYGQISYISWSANNGACQGGKCGEGSVNNNTVLPMHLVDFNVDEEDGAVYVWWSTASEVNHDRYILERSFDMIEFEPVSSILSAGSPDQVAEYEFIDRHVPPGNVTYRLKSIDLDGSYEFSAMASIEIAAAPGAGAYPNPTDRFVYVDNLALLEEAGPIYLVNTVGLRIPVEFVMENGRARFDIGHVKPGVYSLQTALRSFKILLLSQVEK